MTLEVLLESLRHQIVSQVSGSVALALRCLNDGDVEGVRDALEEIQDWVCGEGAAGNDRT
ncbi:MAG: hypothetical protein AAGD10_20975 [Myxococcota bacterium]